MLEELLKYNRLGSRSDIEFILYELKSRSAGLKIDDLKLHCISNNYSISRSFDGIISLLSFVGYVSLDRNNITLDASLEAHYIFKAESHEIDVFSFNIRILNSLIKEGVTNYIFPPNAIKFDTDSKVYFIKDSLVSTKFTIIRNLFLELEFYNRDISINQNRFLINGLYTNFFKKNIIDKISSEHLAKRKLTSEELQKSLLSRAKNGIDAEVFVLNYEKRRLKVHHSLDLVKRISEDYVNAGYDIESFDSKESVYIDRFIEVKSFSQQPEFYWSRNEIEIAEMLGVQYFIYLIDSNRISELNYNPTIINNPFKSIYLNEGVHRTCESIRVSL
ncbi:DUF3883 domain-containing protein [Fibrella forsythiae]|uniref:DUF3883 domain-containing protein n=1 Tax=Fibrella forsythiae TaxID=2817061 RepID=A0ABS3JW41_9BACT|nr:DUF3883 domain-containing protein [Fibrella forsythiae]MBO0953117.1 DUF3883 domain-containing protein [Fibrella forsythiae]